MASLAADAVGGAFGCWCGRDLGFASWALSGWRMRVVALLSPRRLRSLLRYLAVRGFADPGLACAVPRVARWRVATIPQLPTRPEIDRILASCDRQDATGARDYAVLLLLARLGLRAVEVSRLRLDDLDWRAGQIIVDGKAHQRDQLPLPCDVGEAIVEHLEASRRQRGGRRVFLTVHAPIRPLEPSGVRTIVRQRLPAGRHRADASPQAQACARERSATRGRVDDRHRPGAAPQAPGEHRDLRQGRPAAPPRRLTVAGSARMTSFGEHVDDYLRLRRALGFGG
jgi:integrase